MGTLVGVDVDRGGRARVREARAVQFVVADVTREPEFGEARDASRKRGGVASRENGRVFWPRQAGRILGSETPGRASSLWTRRGRDWGPRAREARGKVVRSYLGGLALKTRCLGGGERGEEGRRLGLRDRAAAAPETETAVVEVSGELPASSQTGRDARFV